MRAAVGAADTVDRIQRRENDKHQNDGEPTHLSIICNGPEIVDTARPVEHP
jgi:hypothetical protein